MPLRLDTSRLDSSAPAGGPHRVEDFAAAVFEARDLAGGFEDEQVVVPHLEADQVEDVVGPSRRRELEEVAVFTSAELAVAQDFVARRFQVASERLLDRKSVV